MENKDMYEALKMQVKEIKMDEDMKKKIVKNCVEKDNNENIIFITEKNNKHFVKNFASVACLCVIVAGILLGGRIILDNYSQNNTSKTQKDTTIGSLENIDNIDEKANNINLVDQDNANDDETDDTTEQGDNNDKSLKQMTLIVVGDYDEYIMVQKLSDSSNMDYKIYKKDIKDYDNISNYSDLDGFTLKVEYKEIIDSYPKRFGNISNVKIINVPKPDVGECVIIAKEYIKENGSPKQKKMIEYAPCYTKVNYSDEIKECICVVNDVKTSIYHKFTFTVGSDGITGDLTVYVAEDGTVVGTGYSD